MLKGQVAMAIAISAMMLTGACSNNNKQPELMNIRSSTDGPDEFAVLPAKPLEMPETLAALPAPTPGGVNRTDPTPEADAIVALGGRPEALTRGGVRAADGGLVGYASRYGVTPDIRQVLAAEDLQYRRNNDGRLLERVFNVNVYYRAYEPLSLDQYAELTRWRSVGIRTPAAPPPKKGEEPNGYVEAIRAQELGQPER